MTAAVTPPNVAYPRIKPAKRMTSLDLWVTGRAPLRLGQNGPRTGPGNWTVAPGWIADGRSYSRPPGSAIPCVARWHPSCSLRFLPKQFGEHRAEVEAAGFEAGEGFIKLPYDRPLPIDLLKRLLQYRLTDFEATGSGW
jgi:hypothetical protein